MNKNKTTAIIIGIIVSLGLSVLFSFSDVNFQSEYVTLKLLGENFLIIGVPVIITGLIILNSNKFK